MLDVWACFAGGLKQLGGYWLHGCCGGSTQSFYRNPSAPRRPRWLFILVFLGQMGFYKMTGLTPRSTNDTNTLLISCGPRQGKPLTRLQWKACVFCYVFKIFSVFCRLCNDSQHKVEKHKAHIISFLSSSSSSSALCWFSIHECPDLVWKCL